MNICSRIKYWIYNDAVTHIFLMTWIGINVLTFYRTYSYYKHSPEYYYLHEILGIGLCLSRAASSVINLNIGALLLPMCRCLTSFLRTLFARKAKIESLRRITDHSKGFHIICAWFVVFATVGHIIGHLFNAKNYSEHYDDRFPTINAACYPNENPLVIIVHSVPGITGVALLVILSMIISSATRTVRTSEHRLFWTVHRLFIIFYILIVFHAIQGVLKRQTNTDEHVPGCIYINQTSSEDEPIPEHEPLPDITAPCSVPPKFDIIGSSTWVWLTFPLVLYMCDILYRILFRQSKLVEVQHVHEHPENILELEISKPGFSCYSGQYVLVQCPAVSSLEWHPFTITKFNQDTFHICMKVMGDWTARVTNELKDNNTESANRRKQKLPLYIDGPFSSPMEDILKYKICICVAGGIGITPFLAVLNQLRCSDTKSNLQRLHIIWIGKSLSTFSFAFSQLDNTYKMLWSKNLPDLLNIELFLTKQTEGCRFEGQTFLNSRIHYGRPRLRNMIQNISSCHTRNTIGLFCCGPKGLNHRVRNLSKDMNLNGVRFHFYHESF